MNISIVIPNYNGEEILKENLQRTINIASQYTRGKIEIIVVDDASQDNSIEILNTLKEKNNKKIPLHVLKNNKNLGFSSTVNKGILNSKYEIVVLLNTDVVPEEKFLYPLLQHFKDQKVFGVGCMDKSIEGNKTILRGRGIGGWERGFLIHSRGEVDKSDTLWVSGGSSAIKKDTFEKIGGFDTSMNPFYWEDIDLSYRAQKAGYKLIFEKKSIVEHIHSKGSIKKHYSPSQVKTIAYRNQFIFIWKNITDGSLIFSHLAWLPVHMASAVLRGDMSFIKAFFLAALKIPDIINKRTRQEKLFIIHDKDILNNYSK